MQERLHVFRWAYLAKNHLHRIVFKNDPSMRPVVFSPLHRKLSMRIFQRVVRIGLYPFLWPKEFVVMDPLAKFALQMWIEPDESAFIRERVFVIETTFFDRGEIQSGLWAYREPGFWHCHDSHTVPVSDDTIDDFREKYQLAMGIDPFKQR